MKCYYDSYHYTYVSFTSDNQFKYLLQYTCVTFTLMHIVSIYYVICVFFPLIVVLRLGIRSGWLIYLVVWPDEVMSGKLVNTCSAGYNNCKHCIDTHLTFQALSCTSNVLSEIFLQILKLGLYFESNVSFEVWFFSKTMPPILIPVLSGSLTRERHLSLAILRFNIAII